MSKKKVDPVKTGHPNKGGRTNLETGQSNEITKLGPNQVEGRNDKKNSNSQAGKAKSKGRHPPAKKRHKTGTPMEEIRCGPPKKSENKESGN